MELRYTVHARDAMVEDDISVEDLNRVLDAPTWQVATTRGNRYDAWVEGRRLAVVVDARRDPPLVVTAFWVDEE